jgi:hypothetical protein
LVSRLGFAFGFAYRQRGALALINLSRVPSEIKLRDLVGRS